MAFESFPRTQMPMEARPGQAGTTRSWYGPDTEERYRSRPHPTLGPADVVYRFNRHGYRCPEFPDSATDLPPDTLSMVSIGASEVLGTGVPEEQVFGQLVAQQLQTRLGRPVMHWNLGSDGSSLDTLVRTLLAALTVLKPALVLMVFTYPWRRECITPSGRILYYNRQSTDASSLLARMRNPEMFETCRAYANLASDFNDELHLFKNYQTAAALCQKHQVMWLYSALETSFLQPIRALVDEDHLVLPCLGQLRAEVRHDPAEALARDMMHPGIGPHRRMAELMLQGLERRYAGELNAMRALSALGAMHAPLRP